MTFKQLHGKAIREAFKVYHEENPHIYEKFAEYAFKAIARGKKKLSAKMIVNVIRWEEFLSSDGDQFRINDAFHSYYARLFMEKNEQFLGIFELRKLRNEEPAPYVEVQEDNTLEFL